MRRLWLTLLLGACAGLKPPVNEDFSDLGDEKSDAFSKKMKLLGTIEYGQSQVAAYHNPPRFIAYKFFGKAGESVVLDVTGGDPVAWIVDDSFRILAENDDVSASDRSSHIETTLSGSGVTYYIIVRDYSLKDGEFTVGLTAPSHHLDSWRGRSIYFIVTDRFANGDPSNDNAGGFAADSADPDAWHGGDFQGVIDHLDYIAGMGFTALWLTPVVQQHDKHAYHGYWGWDFRQIDGHLGTLDKLRELVQAAHARGLSVMIDTVANHTGRYGYASPMFPDASMYHHNGNITNWTDPLQLTTFDVNGLNDLDQDQPAVRQALLDHARWLVASTGADALRVDTVKHVSQEFWSVDSAAAGVFTIGEALNGEVASVAPFSHALDAVLDYPLYYGIRNVFSQGQSARGLSTLFAQDSAYRDPLLSGVFVDNHDQPRFLCDALGSQSDKESRLRLALAFAFTARGLPILYYGTEQAFSSCTANRADMFNQYDATNPLYQYIKTLNQIRNANPALRIGTQLERWQDDSAYAFERESGTSAALVAFNVGTTARTLAMHHLHVPAGTVLRDALSGFSATVDANLNLSVSVPASSVLILTHD